MSAAAAPILTMGQNELTRAISGALQSAFGDERDAAKRVAIIANTNDRTAENWLLGRNAPDVLHLLRLAAQIPELQAVVRQLAAMEADMDPELDRALSAVVTLMQRKARP